jgi:general secretion pathway protein A
MYEKFFYFKENPFHITPNPRFLYLSSKHREAMDLLSHGIARKKGFILLTGEVGTGKTTLCRAILNTLPKSVASALVLNPILSYIDLLRTITGDLGLEVSERSAKAHIDALNKFLLNVASKGGNAIVIFDEAQNLSLTSLETIRLLSNLETNREKLLQIILVGQPELREKLKLPQLRQLNQRIVVRYHLRPLSLDEVEGYIQNRLFIAGGRGTVKFTQRAIRHIYTATCGIPRLINIICDRALTAAFAEGKRVVDGTVAAKAHEDLKGEGALPETKDTPKKRHHGPTLFKRFMNRLQTA